MKLTKLYELTKGDSFIVAFEDEQGSHIRSEEVFTFSKIDGAYSICYDQGGNIVHWAAYTPVELITETKENCKWTSLSE